MKLITKSKYLNFLQCPKLFYMRCFEPQSIPEPDLGAKAIFEQGNDIGLLAQKCFKNAITVPFEDFKQNIAQTQELLKEHKTLFEAGFTVDDLFCRVDVLEANEDGSWNLIEVKGATEVKDQYIDDVTFQYYCLNKIGLNIKKCYLMHIDTSYVLEEEIKPDQLFKLEDMTNVVKQCQAQCEENINNARKFLKEHNTCPDVQIGEQCSKPYDCALKKQCWSHIPKHSVFELYRMQNAKKLETYFSGIETINQIPCNMKLTTNQHIQVECVQKGKVHIDKSAIQNFLDKLEYPLYYMDFETIFPAIPLYKGMGPYKHLCFQYSVHIQQEKGGGLEHHEYLATQAKDCREEFLIKLLDDLDTKGSIIVFNQSFEIARLKELAKQYPKHEKRVKAAIERIIDLLVPFRSFEYYHPDQHGSASIKKVLPALTGKGYEDLDIAQGGDACIKYYYCTYKEKPGYNKEEIYPALLKYCCLDTEGMVWIVDELYELV